MVAKAALEAGKHVLCEKPLATTLQDAFDLVETADKAERVLVVSQNYRYNAPFRAVQRLVMEGELGKLASIRISCRRDTRTLFARTISGTLCATHTSSTCLPTTSTS